MCPVRGDHNVVIGKDTREKPTALGNQVYGNSQFFVVVDEDFCVPRIREKASIERSDIYRNTPHNDMRRTVADLGVKSDQILLEFNVVIVSSCDVKPRKERREYFGNFLESLNIDDQPWHFYFHPPFCFRHILIMV